MKKIFVGYHQGCPDGVVAAALMLDYVRDLNDGFEYEFLPISYGNEYEQLARIEKESANKTNEGEEFVLDAIFLDYCPPAHSKGDKQPWNILSRLNYIVIDHHEDRVKDLKPLLEPWQYMLSTFGNAPSGKASGSLLTAQFIAKFTENPEMKLSSRLDCGTIIRQLKEEPVDYGLMKSVFGDKLTQIIYMVSDYDTWTLVNPQSPDIFNGIGVLASSFKWDLNEILMLLVSSGSIRKITAAYEGTKAIIEHAISTAGFYPSETNPILALVNAPKSQASEIGRLLIARTLVSVVIIYTHNMAKQQLEVSIRTADDTPIDALEIAKILRGGGHQNAAAARLGMNESLLDTVFGPEFGEKILSNIIYQIGNPRK